jgi:hypothetical protein
MSEAIVTQPSVLRAIAGAADVELSAYVLRRQSPVVRALEAAGDRGARVSVRLDAAPYIGPPPADDVAAENRRVAVELRAHGVAVRLSRPDEPPLHLKAALVDGTAFLDDRNWPVHGGDTILSTSDDDDVGVVARALRGTLGCDGHMAAGKSQALLFESESIAAGTGDRVDVESESFGRTAVSKALYARARAGAHVRLLVSERVLKQAGPVEHAALQRLARAGVEVRAGTSAEKLCVAGDRGWVGSANATFSSSPMADWGVSTRRPALLRDIETAFERNWARAEPACL